MSLSVQPPAMRSILVRGESVLTPGGMAQIQVPESRPARIGPGVGGRL